MTHPSTAGSMFKHLDGHDYVIVGGGTAGCVLANRLSENPEVRVLLLEAGAEDWNPLVHMPAGIAQLVGQKGVNWDYNTAPDPNLKQRSLWWPRGKVVGGSSSINAMCYIRGHARDYDEWEALGCEGWNWNNVLPYFRKSEGNVRGSDAFHGADGPLTVSDPRHLNALTPVFLEAANQAGFEATEDFNGARQKGFGLYQTTTREGSRCSSAVAYLRPARKRPNLKIITKATASRIVFEDGRASAVVYAVAGKGGFCEAASREVILCGGSINSPQLLMLSGIGDAQTLQDMGIQVQVNAPEVGKNLQDHFMVRFAYRTKPCGTLNEIMANPIRAAGLGLEWALRRKGQMAVGASEASLFARVLPGSEEPEVQFQFVNFSLGGNQGTSANSLAKHPGFTFNFCVCRPDSRGDLTLRSPNVADKPVIRANYLTAPSDIRIMLESAKLGRRIAA